LSLWFDAADASTYGVSTGVSSWRSKGATGITVTQETGANQPTLATRNGRPCLSFNGSSTILSDTTTRNYTVGTTFLVGNATGFNTAPSAIAFGTTSVPLSRNLFRLFPNKQTFFTGDTADAFPPGDPVTSMRINGAISRTLAAGDPFFVATSFGASTVALTGRPIVIGADILTRVWTGNICEVLMFSVILPAEARIRVERYLAAKWGVTLEPVPTATNADAQAWIDRVYSNGGTVSTATANAVNTFCTSIESAGLRDRFYRLNLFAGTGLSAALVPLYRGQSLGGTQFGNATDTNNNFVSGDYVETGATGGLLGNGSNKYLNTGLAGNSLTFGNAHLSGYMVTPPSSGTYVSAVGALTALNSDEFALNCNQNVTATTTPFFSEENTAGGFVAGAVNNPNGFLVGASTSSTDRRFYRNGSQSGSTVTTALARSQYSNLPLFVMARNFTSSPTGYNNGRMAAYSVGAGMTAGQVSSYYTALQAFQTALMRNV
jgi:hypothetical protein